MVCLIWWGRGGRRSILGIIFIALPRRNFTSAEMIRLCQTESAFSDPNIVTRKKNGNLYYAYLVEAVLLLEKKVKNGPGF